MTNHSIEELFPFYALGTLNETERTEVETYLATNPEAQKRLDELIQTVAHLPYEAAPVAPSPQTKIRLMARVRAEAQTTKPTIKPAPSFWVSLQTFWERFRSHPVMVPAFALASLVLITAVSLWATSLNRQLVTERNQVTTLQSQLMALETELNQVKADKVVLETNINNLLEVNQTLQEQLQDQNEVLAILESPNSHSIPIAGKEPQPHALGKLVVQPETNTAVFVASNLDQLPSTKVYQLWMIQGDQPIGMGTFQVDEAGHGVITLQANTPLIEFTAVGVSIEPTGGSSQPTGDIVLLGAISS